MNEASMVSDAGFVAYEYTTVRPSREMEPLYRNAYRAFGWIVVDDDRSPRGPSVTLQLMRDRHIKNRPMILELQHKAENALAAITRLERSKTTLANGAAIAVGLVGAVLLAGSVLTLDSDSLGWSVTLGVLGLIEWVLGQVTYARVRASRTARLTPLIERQLDVVREACEQAGHLIY